MHQSEIALLRQRIAEEYEAIKQGLNGLAWGTAKHEIMDLRMRRVDQYQGQLARHIGESEATLAIYDLYNQVMG
ncbi:hypothetical protein KSD_37900 [Ktedonobacter sp. SOSP1-85]|uniref:Uncharacterized protein n=2 Tax=Ktedonobacter TaxID=363276 RepID=D6TLN5_KTERA|nr:MULTISPECIES: hypothetical protein [Ktedonobacter]EFH86685.1 hypothetical protein Krac_7996 [Ktedonobacter racemifer DSM 44963]GHO52405.1 hypothetical protein KSB_08800 [Ktedonobacter robiniae]GHO65971.1 hypothetical protein KSC_048630 [Ktedonobacter sp. SOSP1-52]GHO76019.1 hypothetical protein KSD_37900 [Ktedonobacter sp. SOSP1-85]